tara:strand:+ start:1597 stop:3879 length:2283 start_codon:yes stop_codon:yes gene_type:complete
MENYTLGGYPDPFATQEEKLQKSYGINYFKRMYYDWVNDTNVTDDKSKRYERCRNYADGLQSVDKYKDIVGAEGDTSYLSLNWEVVPIIPKFVDVLMGGLINQEHKIKCSAIDPVSLDKRMQDKLDIEMNMAMKEHNKKMALITKLPFDKNQENLPRDNDELELYMQLNYKQAVEIAMEQGIELSLYLNEWSEVRKRVIRDLITLNIGATKTGVDPNGITMRYVNPSNLITSYSRNPDFKNITHAGEIIYMTIQDLKRIAGDEFTEEDYKNIAQSNVGKLGNPKKFTYKSMTKGVGSVYEYDSYKIAILDGVFKAIDPVVYEKKTNSFGGSSYNKKNGSYKVPKKSKNKRSADNVSVEMIYKGKYIIGSDYIFDYGHASNILRPKSNLTKAILPYSIYAPNLDDMDGKSLVERMIPFADQIQLAHLKIQQLMAKAKPKGSAIELGAIENVTKGDGGSFSPLEIQDIYQQTGNLYYRMQEDDGSQARVAPIQELGGGIGGALQELIAIYQYNLQMIRDVTGINESRDGSQPDKESLVGVQKMALLASNNATRWLNEAYVSIFRRTAKSLALRVQDIVEYKGVYDGYMRALGEFNMKAVSVTKDVTMADFGIMIEALPDEEEKAILENNIQMSIKTDSLRIEDAITIRGIRNIKLANQMLMQRRKQYAVEKEQMAQKNSQMNAQIQQQSIAAKSQAEMQAKQVENEMEMKKIQTEYLLKEEFAKQEHARRMKEIEMQGKMKAEHIKIAQEDIESDMTRIRKR